MFYIINRLLTLAYWLLIISIVLRILIKRRTITTTMSWLLFIYILPLIGVVAYLLLGELYLIEHYTKQIKNIRSIVIEYFQTANKLNSANINYSNVAKPLFQLCEKYQGIPGITCNQLRLITNYEKTVNFLINDIKLAKKNIDMVFYIWYPGGLTDKIAKSLIDAAHRGVHCRLMLDSVGSIWFFRSSWPKAMKDAGISVVKSLKVNLFYMFLRRIDLRQHRKLVLIDHHIAYIGSMNLVDHNFFKKNTNRFQCIDLMMRMEGLAVIAMSIIYSYNWGLETGNLVLPPPEVYKFKKQTNKYNVQIIASGPGHIKDIIHQSLLTAIYSAHEQLIITTPYLIPSDSLIYAMCAAAHRGVDVIIIIPRYSDSFLVKWASRSFFSELLNAGVKIYLFEGGLLHTKSILVDSKLSLIGTVNLDMRSLWLNSEIIIAIDDNIFSNNLAQIHGNYISLSNLVNLKHWENRSWWKRIIEIFFYFFSPLL